MAQKTSQPATSQHTDDLDAIRRAAMDYLQGWYEADADRMRRSLHPELAKRGVLRDPQTEAQRFTHLTQEQMVAKTAQGGGTEIPADKRYYEVSVLDVSGDIASVRADSYEYVDYLHLARWHGTWVIVNVLWTYKTPR